MNNDIRKIYKGLLEDLENGVLTPGGPVPKEIELARRFSTTRMNAQRAVRLLADQQFVVRKKRAGTRVAGFLDREKLSAQLKSINRSIFVLYSMTPHWIHWNESSFTAFEQVVNPEGYTVTYRNIPTGSGREKYRELLADISGKGASALVIFPDTEDFSFLLENGDLLLDFRMPVYMLNRSGEPVQLDMVSYVSTDPFGDGVTVGRLLKKNNCRNIVMLSSKSPMFWSRKRYEGVVLGLRGENSSGKTGCPQIHLFTDEPEDELKTQFGKIFRKYESPVIVAVNNVFAACFADTAKTLGYTAPKDYTLIAFDDNPLFRSYNFTSLAIPVQEIGEVFGRLICDKSWLRDHKGRISIRLSSKLIIRDTFLPAVL
ncbi:MAG: Bacterial regulatory proteins, gntR family [Lentisphaerae bacterium ADurb.Bin242]|nr:MAG: Bacterial regulatory proteins, gntR family [Lentisphaerae bacterium ADurb.Bin242]